MIQSCVRNSIGVLALGSVLFIAGCGGPKATTTTTKTPQSSRYSEDLSALRPKIEITETAPVTQTTNDRKATPYIEPKFTVNKQVDAVLDSLNRYNISGKTLDGFTIQVYSGLNREQALSIKKQLTTSLADIPSEVHYQQPNFRVKAGRYYSRVSAQKDYLAVKKHFPAAVIVPEKLPIQ